MATPDAVPFGGDRSQAPMLRAVLSTELAVATIVVGLRFYTRLRLTRSPGMDDWIMLATWIFGAIGTSMDLAGTSYGIGRHVHYLSHNNAVLSTKLDWLGQALIIPALTIGKISVAFLILRISIIKWHAYFLHTINVILLLINIPLIIWTYAQCRPAARLWDPTVPGACQDPKMQGSFAIFQGSFGAATDLVYALFPIVVIWPLRMPRKRKIQLASIMCLGTFSAAAGAVKTFYLQQLRSRADFTYDATSLMVWYTTEMYVIIVAGSLPTLRPLFQKAVSTYSSFKGRSSKGYLSHDDEHKHELQNLPKKQIDDSILRTTGQTAAGSKEEILPPGGVEGIVKTVDFTIADSVVDGNPQRSEQWEDDGFEQKRVRGDERV